MTFLPHPLQRVHPYNPLATHLTGFFHRPPVIHIVSILTPQFTLAITLPMTTAQETSNGHRVSPPPCDDATGIVSSALSARAPANKSIGSEDLSEPLPDRCQFTFSDGRQCTMARSDIHPSMCPFHAEREEQLFGNPAPGGNVVGAAFDLPELHLACRDLTTAAGVNRALAQVFRLLAQRRISRQEAATFGHLAQLLLRTITLAHAESAAAPAAGARPNGTSPVILSDQREPRQRFSRSGRFCGGPLCFFAEHPSSVRATAWTYPCVLACLRTRPPAAT